MFKRNINNTKPFSFDKLIYTKSIKITRWVEAIVIVISFPAIGYIIDPLDPFFMNYQFPWLVFAPLLISLRYGFLYGITTASLLIIIISTGFYLDWPEVQFFPQEMIIGLLLLTIISAEFYELWDRKIKLLEKKYAHIKVRMDKFARTYHLIKGSHFQLEQHLASQTKSLRSTLFDLSNEISSLEAIKGEPLAGISESILKIFGAYTNVHMAGIYAVNERREIATEALAHLGKPCALLLPDPLIQEALRTGHTACIKIENYDPMDSIGSLVAVPLVDVHHRIWGMVVVNEMPLFALQSSTLDLFTILGGRVGDLIQRRVGLDLSINNDRKIFERKLRRILEEVSYLDESAVVIAISIGSEELERKFHIKFQTELRGVDELWILTDNPNYHTLLILLPFTDQNGAVEFLNRTELCKLSSAKEISNKVDRKIFSYNDGSIKTCLWLLDHKTSRAKILLEIYQFCKNGFIDNEVMEYKNASVSNNNA